jgi:hypothetical protein
MLSTSRRRGFEVKALELRAGMLNLARKRPNVTRIQFVNVGQIEPLMGIGMAEPPTYALHLCSRCPSVSSALAKAEQVVQQALAFNRPYDYYVSIMRRHRDSVPQNT